MALALAAMAGGTAAKAAPPQQELIEKAALTAESLVNDPSLPSLRATLKDAKGVLVVPSLIKGGFILGAEGGSGVLLARNAQGVWSDPAFYTLGAGSIGLQAGVQDSEVVLVIVTEKGLNAILDKPFKIGADGSIAVGPMGGAGIAAGTTAGLGADIYSFSRTRGIFAGLSLDGTAIVKRDSWNVAYYGKGATPRGILIERRFNNPGATRLRQALLPKQSTAVPIKSD
jgi:lipid-binding SYLF domain-containing protein